MLPAQAGSGSLNCITLRQAMYFVQQNVQHICCPRLFELAYSTPFAASEPSPPNRFPASPPTLNSCAKHAGLTKELTGASINHTTLGSYAFCQNLTAYAKFSMLIGYMGSKKWRLEISLLPIITML